MPQMAWLGFHFIYKYSFERANYREWANIFSTPLPKVRVKYYHVAGIEPRPAGHEAGMLSKKDLKIDKKPS